MHAFVKLAVNQSAVAHKMAVLPALPLAFRQQRLQHFYLLRVQKRIILPAHRTIPGLRIMIPVQINFLVHPRQSHQRRHRSPKLAAGIQHPHSALIINILGRFLIKPYPILTGSLKALPSLITALKTNHRGPAMHALYQNKINHAGIRAVLPSFAHHDLFDPLFGQIGKQLFLRNVPLYLLGQADHPAFGRPFDLPERMNTSGIPHSFYRAALGFSRTVAAEHPAVALWAGMKLHLLFMHLRP